MLNGGGILGICALPDADFATAIAAAYNDWLTHTWLGEWNADGRFKGSMMIAPQDPEAAAREIDRSAGHPHIVQVMFASATTAPMGQKQFHPIYEAAERNGLPVAIHPGVEGRSITGPAHRRGLGLQVHRVAHLPPPALHGPRGEPGLPGGLRQVPRPDGGPHRRAASAGCPT